MDLHVDVVAYIHVAENWLDHSSRGCAVIDSPCLPHSSSEFFSCLFDTTHQVCVWVDSYTRGREAQPARSGPFCFDGSRQQLPIDGLELGSHRCVRLCVCSHSRFAQSCQMLPQPPPARLANRVFGKARRCFRRFSWRDGEGSKSCLDSCYQVEQVVRSKDVRYFVTSFSVEVQCELLVVHVGG